MSDTKLYKEQLLDHFKNPRNKAEAPMLDKEYVYRGSNPRCGDDIEIGFNVVNEHIDALEFRGRGCSICLSAASMMTEEVNGYKVSNAEALATDMTAWVNDDQSSEDTIPKLFEPLSAVKHHPARKKCLMLCWNALSEGLEDYND